jgi:hypothetical protein
MSFVLILECGIRHVDVHVAPVSYGRWAVSVDAVSVRRLVLRVLVHVVLHHFYQTANL